jgi:hypothetical protein
MFSVDKVDRPKYYKYLARMNYECARSADKVVGSWPGYEIAAPPPVMALCAQAIELSLKAYLLDRGEDEASVRKLNHRLEETWNLCITKGIRACDFTSAANSLLTARSSDGSSGRVSKSFSMADPITDQRIPENPQSTNCLRFIALSDA